MSGSGGPQRIKHAQKDSHADGSDVNSEIVLVATVATGGHRSEYVADSWLRCQHVEYHIISWHLTQATINGWYYLIEPADGSRT
jgi:hypothetical protein